MGDIADMERDNIIAGLWDNAQFVHPDFDEDIEDGLGWGFLYEGYDEE